MIGSGLAWINCNLQGSAAKESSLTLFYSGHAAHADCLCSSLTLLQLTMSNHMTVHVLVSADILLIVAYNDNNDLGFVAVGGQAASCHQACTLHTACNH